MFVVGTDDDDDDKVLGFEVVKEDDAARGRFLLYFVIDGTGVVVPPDHDAQARRAPVRSRGGLLLRPKDLGIGVEVKVNDEDTWRILDAEPATRRYYKQFGLPLGSRIADEKPLRFFGFRREGERFVIDYYDDATVAIFRQFHDGSLEPWCAQRALVVDGRHASAASLYRAMASGNPAYLGELQVTLDDCCDEEYTDAPLRFEAEFSGIVRGYSVEDAAEKLAVNAFRDRTVSVEFLNDGRPVLRRMHYFCRPSVFGDPRPIWLPQLVVPSVLLLELPRSGSSLHELRVLGPADRRTHRFLRRAEQGIYDFAPSLKVRGLDDVQAAVAVAVAVVDVGGGNDACALALARLAARLYLSRLNVRRLSRTMDKATNLSVERLVRLLEAKATDRSVAALRNEEIEAVAASLRTTTGEPRIDDFVDAVALAIVAATPSDDNPVGRWLARKVASFVVSPRTLRSAFRARDAGKTGTADAATARLVFRDRGCLLSPPHAPFDYEAYCDEVYCADFSNAAPPKPTTTTTTARKPDESLEHRLNRTTTTTTKDVTLRPVDRASPEVVRAHRNFATAFGRAHRHRALRARLATQIPRGQPDHEVTRNQFAEGVNRILAEGQIDIRRADLDLLADFAFATSPTEPDANLLRHPCDAILAAMLASGDQTGLLALRTSALKRRIHAGTLPYVSSSSSYS